MKNYSGKTINQYYLAKDLGQGGMAVVYKAFDNALNRDVVIKMIRTEDLDGRKQADIIQRFTPLANSLGQLNHPNLAPVLDHGFFEDVPYLVTEFLPGGTLKQRMRKQLTLIAAVQVLSPIADALTFAHRNGILHLDFKPSNVLFHNQDKRPMLTDLGIASLFANSVFDPELFELGFGTPAYMAPEQWHGLATEQSDVYSVGIVFYEMLTGKIANKTETPLAAAFKQNEGLIPDPTEMIAGLSPEVQHFFFKCLALEPLNRFRSMQEMKLAMKRLIFSIGSQKSNGSETGHPQAAKPDVEQDSNVSKMGYEAPRIRPIQEESAPQVIPQPLRPIVEPLQPTISTPLPIQDDFRPSQRPDYIKPRVAAQPAQGPLPPMHLQQKTAKSKPLPENTAQVKSSGTPPVLKINPWVTAMILGLALGLDHLLKIVIIQEVDFLKPDWISSLIGRTIAWLIAGLAIYLNYHLTTSLKLFPTGLAGFALAGILPTLLDQFVPTPYDSWLFEIAKWLMLGLGIGMMFHGPEKLLRNEGLVLIGGWTVAGALSVLPLLAFWLFDPKKVDDAPLYLHAIQGLFLGALLAVAVHKSFQDHFKHDRNAFAKLVACFSVACVISYLIFYGVQNIFLASGISWLVMTGIALLGVAWTTFHSSVPKAQSSQRVTNNLENWKQKGVIIHPDSSGLVK